LKFERLLGDDLGRRHGGDWLSRAYSAISRARYRATMSSSIFPLILPQHPGGQSCPPSRGKFVLALIAVHDIFAQKIEPGGRGLPGGKGLSG
jgi:hypothetical protein